MFLKYNIQVQNVKASWITSCSMA